MFQETSILSPKLSFSNTGCHNSYKHHTKPKPMKTEWKPMNIACSELLQQPSVELMLQNLIFLFQNKKKEIEWWKFYPFGVNSFFSPLVKDNTNLWSLLLSLQVEKKGIVTMATVLTIFTLEVVCQCTWLKRFIYFWWWWGGGGAGY